jgi:hypothetical protein
MHDGAMRSYWQRGKSRHLTLVAHLCCLFPLICPCLAGSAAAQHHPTDAYLLPTNAEVPFCYPRGEVGRWRILSRPLPAATRIALSFARPNEPPIAETDAVEVEGLGISLSAEGWLRVESSDASPPLSGDLTITLRSSELEESQTLALRPAPPDRPISYYADFGDDLIRMLLDPGTGRYRPLSRGAFDQYFRRLRAHGVRRLIVWQSPFPYMADPASYDARDWQRYVEQARAILDDEALSAVLDGRSGYSTWRWLRLLLALRLSPEFGDLLTASAEEHGIHLSASFRPFEPALTKYYTVPAFDDDGEFLWDFLPLASPTTNYRPDEVGFANFRTVLERMDQADRGRLGTIEISGGEHGRDFVDRFNRHGDNLRIAASNYPPLQRDSFVLARAENGQFRLRRFAEIEPLAVARQQVLTGYRVDRDEAGTISISGLNVPDGFRYLVVSSPTGVQQVLDLPAALPVVLLARAGNRIDRVNMYWSTDEEDAEGRLTRVSGIPADGEYYAEFQATEASIARHGQLQRVFLRDASLVIDLGAPWSVEMLDFNQPAARRAVVAEMRAILARPAFDELFINTRSHTQLAGFLGDGPDGVRPIADYRATGRNHLHLGIDLAYAPRDAAEDETLQTLAQDGAAIEQVTCFQPGEWVDACDTPDCEFAWRSARNRHVARGVRALLTELEQAFPTTPMRIVLPQRSAAEARVRTALDELKRPDGSLYGRDYYQHIWGSLNYIRNIGEGMTLLDLSGLRTEPVFLGVRYLPDPAPFDLFVDEVVADLRDNRGSLFRGPRSFFYEAQETLRATDAEGARRGREDRIRRLLSRTDDIDEVILYEAADWLYYLPLSDPGQCGHGYLDRP